MDAKETKPLSNINFIPCEANFFSKYIEPTEVFYVLIKLIIILLR